MALWIELHLEFERAFRRNDTLLLNRILRYAAWCISEQSGPLPNDTSTAVTCAFYEHLPTYKDFWPHFRKWLSPSEFATLMPIFAYHTSPGELEQLKAAYVQGVA